MSESEKDKPTVPDETLVKPEKPVKKHLIKVKWLRITLKTLMWIIIGIILIPVLIYIPPVQTLVKNIALKEVAKSTGMKIEIDRFRLKWPLDVSLQGVSVVEASGDTMVYAKEVIADVKLTPLFKLDVDINRLELVDAGFRMMAPDSSMLLKVKAGFIDIDDKSSVDIKTLDINLNKVVLKDGDLSMVMDVWKQKKTPQDSTSTPLTINMHDIELQNFTFGMSMLPTIDTLLFKTEKVNLRDGLVDLAQNKVTASYLGATDGSVEFLVPTPEYVKTHPVPEVPDTLPPSPPMVIQGDTVEIKNFKALYATAGVKPLPGFDPSYIEVDKVAITLNEFYNAGPSIKLPITRIRARERCGLEIVEGSGTFSMDSIGMKIDDFKINTLYSRLAATADIPMALMEMNKYVDFSAFAEGSVGFPDVESIMPSLKTYTSLIGIRNPLTFNIDAWGSLSDLVLKRLDVSLKDILSLNASGKAANIFDIKKLKGNIEFDGSVTNPGVIDKLVNIKGFNLPKLKLQGKATAANENFAADFTLKTTMGNLAADGKVNLSAESYMADVNVHDINVANFVPDLGIGKVDATLNAKGAGFNPIKPGASTNIKLALNSIIYHNEELKDIVAAVSLHDGKYELNLTSPNEFARFNISGSGTLSPELYTVILDADIANLNLQGLGVTDDVNSGKGEIMLKGSADPSKWIYDVDLSLNDVEWNLGNEFYYFPGLLDIKFQSGLDRVYAGIFGNKTSLDFTSQTNLKHLIDSFSTLGDSISKQVAARDLNVEGLQKSLPPFSLNMNLSGNGIVGNYLNTLGLSVDTVYAHFSNDSIISGNVSVIEFSTGSLRADTLSLSLKQRGMLLDYHAHMGNMSNNPLADLASVNLNGYVGSNRLMLGLIQKNQTGQIGYRLGLTAAFQDSIIDLHFTPLKAMIGYIPWQFNDDNYLEFNVKNYHVLANLMASSQQSSILLKTQTGKRGNDELKIALNNIRVQDFLNFSVFTPPLTASLNADLNVGYIDKWLYGSGSIGVENFTYDKLKVGDFDLTVSAGLQDEGTTGARIGLKIDGSEALAARMLLVPDSTGAPQVKKMGLELTHFPLKIANAFLGPDVLQLSGYLNGDFDMSGSFTSPNLNGYLACDSVGVFIPMMGSSLKFNRDSILVKNNIVDFDDFNIYGANSNPLVISGTVDASSFTSLRFDINANATNFQLIGNDNKSRSDLYGKLFLDLHAGAKGPMEHFNVNANVNILSATDVTYSIPQMTAQLSQHDASGVVKFVNFNDTVTKTKKDSISSGLGMRIVAGLTLEPGMEVQVIYPGTTTTGNAKVEINPSGSLNYFQNYMGDMRLNGQLNIGTGYARYFMPIVGEKRFNFNPDSYVLWNGDILNPTLHISATDDVRASIVENGNSRIVNFQVGLQLTHTLSSPDIMFDLTTEDDISIRNELLSMSADQRSMAAINLLLTGQYTGEGVKTASSDLLQGTMYNLLTAQVNGWLANNVKGVDLSLGVDQYDTSTNGEGGSATNYSYTVSKSLFNNKFKISVGGNYSTDASADENFSENLISDISFEYILKQTTNVTMYARLFRHTGYESILEGEITETGVGFLLRRRLANLKDLFRWGSSTIPAAPTGFQGMPRLRRDSVAESKKENPVDSTALKSHEKKKDTNSEQ